MRKAWCEKHDAKSMMRKAWWVLLRRWLFTTGNGEEFASKLRGLHCFFSISEIGFKDFLFYPYLGKTWLVFFKWDKTTNWKMIFQQTFLPVLNVFVCHLCIANRCVWSVCPGSMRISMSLASTIASFTGHPFECQVYQRTIQCFANFF